jgi:hypothetical protein
MIVANLPVQRPSNAKVLIVGHQGHIKHQARFEFVNLLRLSDVVVANDAATLPTSLFGQHSRTGRQIEIRLAGRDSLDEVGQFSAVVFGEGDFRTPTESRSKSPALIPGDRLELGRLRGDCGTIAESSALDFVTIRGLATGDLGGAGPARATCPICTPSDPTCRLGHLDINSRSTSRFRAAFSWTCS